MGLRTRQPEEKPQTSRNAGIHFPALCTRTPRTEPDQVAALDNPLVGLLLLAF